MEQSVASDKNEKAIILKKEEKQCCYCQMKEKNGEKRN